MSKTIEPITWKTWKPVTPADFPCLICGSGREAVFQVMIDDAYHISLCGPCSQLPEAELKAKLFKKAVK